MKIRLFLAFILLSVGFLSTAKASECSKGCSGGDVQINLAARCMCLGQGNCFKVSIGSRGPAMTAGGSGIIGDANGAKYQTKPGPGSTSYDNDALAMGIPANDKVGKWIHKTQRCAPGGGATTKGCVAVPCDKWPEVKKMKGKRVQVCGGGALPGSRYNRNVADPPRSSGGQR